MSPGIRPVHRPAACVQPLFSLLHLIAVITGSIVILSCSAPSEKTPLIAQTFPQSRAGTLQNEEADSERLRSLARHGDAEAQYQLARRYAAGYGAGNDYGQAFHWWHLAAQQGLAKAQFTLGVLYANGRGVDTDHTRAVHWYRQAAVQGLAEAQYNLGMHYWLGKGVPRDPAMAVKWLRKAADQNLPQARYNLSLVEKWYPPAAVQMPAPSHYQPQASP